MNENIFNILKKRSHNSKIDCKIAWEISQEKGKAINNIGSSIKNSDIKVSNCQLGCFKEEENHGFIMASN